MQSQEKQLVQDFFESAFYKDETVISKYLHPEVTMYWNSSEGFSKLKFNDFIKLASEMKNSYEALTCETTHLLQENNKISIRFTYHANTIEHPEDDGALAHFICIWEIKDEKLYEGYIISQPGDDSIENITSFIPKK